MSTFFCNDRIQTFRATISITLIFLSTGAFLSGCISPNETKELSEIRVTSNGEFNIRIRLEIEELGYLPGTYYVFESAKQGAKWKNIMKFRHDDRPEISKDQVGFLSERIAFVYMGWMYAVTTNAGDSWSVWDANRDLPGWKCCNYNLIQSIKMDLLGVGTMKLLPIPGRISEPYELHTVDYGKSWLRNEL